MTKKTFWVGLLGGVAASILIGFFAVPALGVVEMTATGKPGPLDWWGHTNWRSSLSWRAPQEQVPKSADIGQGLRHYQASCLQCHGAPGIDAAGWSRHMQPQPPLLWEEPTQQLSDGELFYVICNGVRMTGMPAFGGEHRKQEIWGLVAFIRQLNELSAEQRQQLTQPTGRYQHEHEHGGHGHHESDPAPHEKHHDGKAAEEAPK